MSHPPIGATVEFVGALGRIKKLVPANLPEFAVVEIGEAQKTLRLGCLIENEGIWKHVHPNSPQSKAEKYKQRLRWKSEPATEPKTTELLSEHWEKLASLGFTQESFKRFCEAGEITFRQGYAQAIRANKGVK